MGGVSVFILVILDQYVRGNARIRPNNNAILRRHYNTARKDAAVSDRDYGFAANRSTNNV